MKLPKHFKHTRMLYGITFAGTLVILLGALVAATIIAITINRVYGTLATSPYIMVSNSYYIVNGDRIHFTALFYNIAQGYTRFRSLKLYLPLVSNGEEKVSIITVYGNTSIFNETDTPVLLNEAIVSFGSRVKYAELLIEESSSTGTAYPGSQYYVTKLRFHLISGEVVEMTLNLTDAYGNTYPAPTIVRYIHYANGSTVQLFTEQRYVQIVQNLTNIPFRTILRPGDIIEIHIDSNDPEYLGNYYDGYIPIQITEDGFRGFYTFDFISRLITLLYYDGISSVSISHETNVVLHNLKTNTTFTTPSVLTRIRWRRIWLMFYIIYRSYFIWDELFNWNGSIEHGIVDYYCVATPTYGTCYIFDEINYTLNNVWEGYLNPLVEGSGGVLYIDVSIPLPNNYKVISEKVLGLAIFDKEVVPVLFSRIR